MVRKLFAILFSIFLISCSIWHNKKYFTLRENIKIDRIQNKGYYYSIYTNKECIDCDGGKFIHMRVFLNNGYMYYVQNGFGNKCDGNIATIDCSIQKSEKMLNEQMDIFLDTSKQRTSNIFLWNWGKYNIRNDIITIQYFYNVFGNYYLIEEKGKVIDSSSIHLFYRKNYRDKRDVLINETYLFKEYNIEKLYDKIPKKIMSLR